MTPVPLSAVDRFLIRQVLSVIGRPPFRLRIGEHGVPLPEQPERAITLRFRDRASLLRVLIDPELAFGEGYSRGDIVVEGDLLDALETVYRAMPPRKPAGWLGGAVSGILDLLQRHDPRGAVRNAHYHYDLGESFYRPWLDRQMLYSCAYYPVPDLTLEQAQIAKMDHICRKLQLLPGERVLEAGCGWGALALYMARHYGVTVRAFNVSREQIRYARWLARQEGMEHRVEFVEDDYRNAGDGFDAFVSVGMLEHVGREHYGTLGKVIQKAVGAAGRGLLHFIGRSYPQPLSTWIRERIFPGAYAPTLGECSAVLEPGLFAILDVENLRPHYANTIHEWLLRFEAARDELRQVADENFLRAWQLYLAGSLVAFRAGTLQLFQVTFAGPEYPRVPWTREHLYAAHYEHSLPGQAQRSTRGGENRGPSTWMTAMS
jgi:cyclopropane-fatty-acyl-phospholipid synthase